jgi:hypothetical protein
MRTKESINKLALKMIKSHQLVEAEMSGDDPRAESIITKFPTCTLVQGGGLTRTEVASRDAYNHIRNDVTAWLMVDNTKWICYCEQRYYVGTV